MTGADRGGRGGNHDEYGFERSGSVTRRRTGSREGETCPTNATVLVSERGASMSDDDDDKTKTGRREVLLWIGAATTLVSVGGVPKVEAQVVLSDDVVETNRRERNAVRVSLPQPAKEARELELCVYKPTKAPHGSMRGFERSQVPIGSTFETWCGREFVQGSEPEWVYDDLNKALDSLMVFEIGGTYDNAGFRLSSPQPSRDLMDRHGRLIAAAALMDPDREHAYLNPNPRDALRQRGFMQDLRVCRTCAAAVLKRLQARVFLDD